MIECIKPSFVTNLTEEVLGLPGIFLCKFDAG